MILAGLLTTNTGADASPVMIAGVIVAYLSTGMSADARG